MGTWGQARLGEGILQARKPSGEKVYTNYLLFCPNESNDSSVLLNSVRINNTKCQNKKLIIAQLSAQTDQAWFIRVRGGPGTVRYVHDCPLPRPHRPHPPSLPLLRGEGGPGLRESRHLQTGPTVDRRSPGARGLLHHSLCGCLWEDRYEESDIWNSPAGGLGCCWPPCCCHFIF